MQLVVLSPLHPLRERSDQIPLRRRSRRHPLHTLSEAAPPSTSHPAPRGIQGCLVIVNDRRGESIATLSVA
jgi:hypothetical protein